MRSIFFGLALFVFSGLYAQNVNPYSQYHLDRFYNLFLEEERGLLAEHGMGKGGNPYDPGTPPSNPPAPDVFKSGYLPFVIVNNSNFPDGNVYITIDTTADSSNVKFISISNDGTGSLVPVVDGKNNDAYVYSLNSLPKTSHGCYLIYMPEVTSGRVWISYGSKVPLQMTVTDTGLQEPGFLPGTSTYGYVFDKMEFNFGLAATPPVVVNATAVDYFSIPIYNYLSGATSVNSNNGLYQKSSYVFQYAKNMFRQYATEKTSTQWNNLLFHSGSTQVLRLCNPAKAMSQYIANSSTTTIFDNNYLENSAYGFDYLSDIWTGTSNFYTTNALTIQSKSSIFRGGVSGSDIVLHGIDGTIGTITFTNPNGLPGSPPVNAWSYQTFANVNSGISAPGVDSNLAENILNLFQEAIVVGLAPTTDTISTSYFSANRSNYFTNNLNLNTSGTGPWYSLYGKALLSLGNIYVFSVNEDLLPDVQLSGPYTENLTYVGITLGKF